MQPKQINPLCDGPSDYRGAINMNEDKFNGKGNIYSKYRPTYPRECIEYFYAVACLTERSVIADIGSGTGILTALLLEKGNPVIAIEPNAEMRHIAEADLHLFSRLTSVAASAEHTTLPDQSVDLITVAQAFHWFDRPVFRNECRRILKPSGHVALIWNSRDKNSPLVAENDRMNRKYCPEFKGFSGSTPSSNDESDFSDFFSGGYKEKRFANDLVFDLTGFIGRNLSASYAPKVGDAQYETYLTDLEMLFEKYAVDEAVTMPNFTECYIGLV